MTDVKNLYTLKPFRLLSKEKSDSMGLNTPRYRIEYSEQLKDSIWATAYIDLCDENDFDLLFVPLDVESLTTQLEDILQNFWQDEDQDLDDSVAEVLELIGMKGKE